MGSRVRGEAAGRRVTGSRRPRPGQLHGVRAPVPAPRSVRGARGNEEGLLEPGRGAAWLSPRTGFSATVQGARAPGAPTLLPFPGTRAGAATWPGLCAWGKRVLGTWLSPELVPPCGSGWGAAGDELRPREAGPGPATSPRSLSEGLPLPPRACRDGGGLPPPPPGPGALGPSALLCWRRQGISSATSSPNPPPPLRIPRSGEKRRVDVLSLILFSCVCVCACVRWARACEGAF